MSVTRFDVSVRPWIITCSIFKGFHKTHYSHHIQLAEEEKNEQDENDNDIEDDKNIRAMKMGQTL